MDFSVLDLSSILGLCALVVLTFNFLLGLMLGTAYRRSSIWKRMPSRIASINILSVHNWTAYVALALIFFHPFLLILDKTTKFQAQHIFLFAAAPHQPLLVAFGVLSFYGFIMVVITTQKPLKKWLGFRTWKNIHLISYITILLVCIHGIFLDPELKDRKPDFFDGEKVLCEVCLLLLVIFSILRMIYFRKNKRKLQVV